MNPQVNPRDNPAYLDWLKKWAANNSDGCSSALEIHQPCCWQHDFTYQMGFDPREYYEGKLVPMTKGEADRLFRVCNQAESPFGWLSPLSWWRWLAVKWFGSGSWRG